MLRKLRNNSWSLYFITQSLLNFVIALFFILEPSCFLPDKFLIGADIQSENNVISATRCQELCQKNPACHYFVLNERHEGQNGCYLRNKAAIKNIIPMIGVTLGPKYCPTGGKEIKSDV